MPAPAVEGLPSPGRCLVVGVVNTTPDSFSDGGRHSDPDTAVAHGHQLLVGGADLLDVGGESTRPGAGRVDAAEEWARVGPVVRRLADDGAAVSVDTTRAEVAARALDAGASLVNDVSGGLSDPAMLRLVADAGVPVVLMHWRAHSEQMQQHVGYGEDLVATVVEELRGRLAAAAEAGVRDDRVVLDPGVGFSKTAEQNWELLRGLDRVAALGRPLLVGASRKSFLGALLADGDGPRPVAEREHATTATTALAAAAGAWAVRVHDARAARDAVEVVAAWQGRSATAPGPAAPA